MIKAMEKSNGCRLIVAAIIMSVLSACSSSEAVTGGPDSALLQDSQSSEQTPLVLTQLSEDTSLVSAVPQVQFTQTLANSGLRVSYTSEMLRVQAPAQTIEAQWLHMQECLQVVGETPLVLVRETEVKPFTMLDDVIRNEVFQDSELSLLAVASASTLYGTVIQIIVEDFDGSLGMANANLRSIMGRRLWLGANLRERDYPYECARTAPN